MIAVAILPQNDNDICVDIYNIQNVKNRCVVEHLLKEICRVREIINDESLIADRVSQIEQLNSLANLSEQSAKIRDLLQRCAKIKTNYFQTADTIMDEKCPDNNCSTTCVPATINPNYFKSLDNLPEYDAYYNGTSLTLVKKSLKLCPEIKVVPCVESLVLFFEYNGRRLINVNVNLGSLVTTFAEFCARKVLVQKVVTFLNQYKDCGEVVMAGTFGDIDYDMDQLLLKNTDEEKCCDLLSSLNLTHTSNVPSELPCDPCDPLYDGMRYLLKTEKANCVPYAWLLQYLRLQKSESCEPCVPCSPTPPCDTHNTLQDCMKCPPTVPEYMSSLTDCDRGTMRHPRTSNNCDTKCVEQPTCVPKPGVSHSSVSCECKCVDRCTITYRTCECKEETCKTVCVPAEECDCKDSRYLVTVSKCDVPTTCCNDCGESNTCCEETCSPEEKCPEYCDAVSVLKRELCLYNTMNMVCDVSNRYTCFVNHVNECLEDRYPRGLFQARTMCQDYEAPTDNSRRIDNNTELLALDHILVSDCLRYYLSEPNLSDLCLENDCNCPPENDNCDFTDYNVRSFFTGRVYCIELDVSPQKMIKDRCLVGQIHDLGLVQLWNILRICENNTDHSVDLNTFQLFGYDKHPYFINYFYRVIRDCNNEILVCEERNTSICEEDFYRHLLCVMTHVKCVDEFRCLIAVMTGIIAHYKKGNETVILSDVEAVLQFGVDLFTNEKVQPLTGGPLTLADGTLLCLQTLINIDCHRLLIRLMARNDEICTTQPIEECSTTSMPTTSMPTTSI
jgi:hypothetical protein